VLSWLLLKHENLFTCFKNVLVLHVKLVRAIWRWRHWTICEPFFYFQAAVLCINFFHRLKFFFNNPPPVSVDVLKTNPYSVKSCRKLLDGCAFKMYGHWVKKADNQNRAALFEHVPRDEWQLQFPRWWLWLF